MTRLRIGVCAIDRGPFATAMIGGSLVVSGLSTRTPWWSCVLAALAVLVTVVVPIRGRSCVRWLLDWMDYRFGRGARAAARAVTAEVSDIEVAVGVCGVRTVGSTLTAMIQLAPNLDLPTVIVDRSVYTEDTILVGTLRPMLDQYGIAVDIDIVSTGQRVRPNGSYSMLYDQLVGTQPVVGHRLTWLIIRLDLERNLTALRRRGPTEVVAPKALATAAHRIAIRLREQGTAAHPLPASAMLEAHRLLHAGVELTDLHEKWGCLESSTPGRYVTSFEVDWARLDGVSLDECWTWQRGWTTLVISLTNGRAEPRAIARYIGPEASIDPPEYLRRLNGRQSIALLATLPTETAATALPDQYLRLDASWDEVFADLAVPIGPNGQILGAITGQPQRSLALPLFDPAGHNPRRRSVDVHAALSVAQQIILRAMVVGADVEVHSTRPHKWTQMATAVGDQRSLRLVSDSPADHSGSEGELEVDTPATIAVFDQVPPHASSARTTMTISEPGGPRQRVVDLAIDQVDATTVDVSIPMRTVRVNLIEPWGETRYYGAPDAVSAGTGVNPTAAGESLSHGRRMS